ncbi:MAG: glycosyltransferase family 4 protein [Patescibacteria group bacterium]|nr:glycosyltransferase family 4 protein [Patescibacteria group bacterium]
MPNKKIKLAILSFYSGLVSRGVETFVAELSLRLKDKLDLTVYHGDSLPGRSNCLSYLFLDSPSLAIKQFTQKSLSKFNDDPPDIIMALNNGWMSWLCKRFCQQHRTKLILAGFSGIGWDDKVNLWLKPDCFVAATSWQAQWAKTINHRARIETINIGVDTNRFRPDGDKFNHGLKPPVILVVAGPQKFKRVDLAIAAVSRLPVASLLVVGQQEDKINGLGRKLLGGRYRNIQVDYQDLDGVYRACRVYTLPSGSSEAYGISILEAMASGLAVVVNDDPIRRELVGKAGILVNPANLNSYTDGLKNALKLGGKNNRQQALKFSWDKTGKQYLDLCSNLV